MWKKTTLTTASNIMNISFKGRGSIYAEGTFGGGVIEAHLVYRADENGAPSISTGYIDSALDGSVVKTLDVPAGDYQLNLSGSAGATVSVYTNSQSEFSVDA